MRSLAKQLGEAGGEGCKRDAGVAVEDVGRRSTKPRRRAIKSWGDMPIRPTCKRPGMLYGRVLRSPKYRAKLVSVDLGAGEDDGRRDPG